MINLPDLIDEAQCFQTVRDLRWPGRVICPHCDAKHVVKDGKDETQPHRRRSSSRDWGEQGFPGPRYARR